MKKMKIQSLTQLAPFSGDRMAKEIVFKKNNCKAVVFNFSPGQSLPLHDHPFTQTFALVASGEGLCYTEDENFPIKEGDLIQCGPAEKIGFENNSSSNLSVYVTLVYIEEN